MCEAEMTQHANELVRLVSPLDGYSFIFLNQLLAWQGFA
jgi:hypothetical protein